MDYIDEFVFETDYKPLPNPTDGGQTWEHRDTLAYPVEQVWTLIDGEDGGIWAAPGYHIVNKIDYVVTAKPWTDETLEAMWVDADDLGQEWPSDLCLNCGRPYADETGCE